MMQHCNRCGGQTVPRYDEVKCLQCGHDQQPKLIVTDKEALDRQLEIKTSRPAFDGSRI
tara:strand:+ start:266 stop:442 length:177 start_codon:yes stop_codon:yes gene_type:complete